ncbi:MULTISPECIES: alpha/beta fold hydrolase [Streptomyces]|uniref:alpha/beta fold hydrolase n=1 Tax=Streptomyces TaxID=1883 RepID=UPI00163BB435|nr:MULTISPECIES: alpha/beta hydrolase [Streptomyces]MBC2875742.1 alpha/beta hydrolase [Streptomyces sp. TYQ1024]UBI37595.1 alpha/beta hydrolase [Streptomyces mobaraensis]UKW30183.1 alpha/beta hydrolase [Streptomyces sp. TYQ1024]
MPFATAAYESQWEPLAAKEINGEPLRVMHHPDHTRGIPILLTHGLEEVWQSWLPLAERLAPRYRLLPVDLPWRANGDYSWSETLPPSRWLAEAVGMLPFAPSALIGHSFGSNTILEYLAGPSPVPVDAVVLTSPIYRARREEVSWEMLQESVVNFRDIISAGLKVRAEGRQFPPEVFEKMVDAILERVGPNGLVNLFRLVGHSPFIELRRIGMPTLIIAGVAEATEVGTGTRALAAALPAGRLELLEDFNHFCQVAQADEVAALAGAHLGLYL